MTSASSRKTYVLLVSFLLLIIFVILFEVPSIDREKGAGTILLYPNFSFDQVSSITITSDGESKEITQEADSWKIKKDGQLYPVDPEVIESITNSFDNAQSATLVSGNTEQFDLYDLQDSKALELTMKDTKGAVIVDMLIGKAGTVSETEYVRLKGENRVLLIPTSLRSVIDKEIDDFRDKRLVHVDDETVLSKVFLQHGEVELEFQKKDGAWQMSSDSEQELDLDAFNSVLNSISNLKVSRFIYDSSVKTGLGSDAPSFGRIVLKLTDGTKQEVWVGDAVGEDGTERYVVNKSNNYVSVILETDVDGIFKEQAEFKKSKTGE